MPADPLAILDGQANALEIDTWPLGRIVDHAARRRAREDGVRACSSDLVTVARRVRGRDHSHERVAARRHHDLDLSRVLSGPYCTMLAADMGARVIKIEHPDRGDDTRAWGPPFLEGESAYYLSVNRNKESVAIDFKTPRRAARVLDALIARADVLVENFRPGTLDRLGLRLRRALGPSSATDLRVDLRLRPERSAPRRGRLRRRRAGRGRTDEHHRHADGPPVRLGVAIADIAAGMFAFQGLLLALIARAQDRTRPAGRRQPARLGRGAAHLSGRAVLRDGRAPDAHRQSAHVHRAVRHVRRRRRHARARRRQRRVSGASSATCSGSTTLARRRASSRPTRAACAHYDALRPQLARADRPRALAIARRATCALPACPAARCDRSKRRSPIRRSSRAQMIETVDHPTIGPLQVLGLPVKLSDTPGRSPDRAAATRRAHARGSAVTTSVLTTTKIQALGRGGRRPRRCSPVTA